MHSKCEMEWRNDSCIHECNRMSTGFIPVITVLVILFLVPKTLNQFTCSTDFQFMSSPSYSSPFPLCLQGGFEESSLQTLSLLASIK